MVSFNLQTHILNKCTVHCTFKFCWWNLRHCIHNPFLQTVFSVRIITSFLYSWTCPRSQNATVHMWQMWRTQSPDSNCHYKHSLNKAQNCLLCELLHCLAWKGVGSLLLGEVVKKQCHNIKYHSEFMVSRNKNSLNVMWWHFMGQLGTSCSPLPVVLRVHSSREMKPSFITKHNV